MRKKIRAIITHYKKIISTRDGYKNLFLHSAFALTFTAGLSYLFGFLRDRFLAQTFGAHASLDVYYAAFVVPDMILALFVTSCVSAALIPLYAQTSHRSHDHARRYFYRVLLMINVLILFSVALLAVLMPYLAPYLVPGFSLEDQKLYVSVVRIMLLSPIIFAFSNLFGGVLLSVRDFFFYGIAPVFYNAGIIFGIVFFVPRYGVMGLAWGTVFGAFLHLFSRIGIAMVRVGKPRWDWAFDDEMKKTLRLMLPKAFQIGAWQLLLVWFVYLASTMEEGSTTIYNFARNFSSMPVSLIGIALALSTFTTLTHLAATKHYAQFNSVFIRKSIIIFVSTTVLALALAIGSHLIIATLLGGKAFDESAITRTATMLALYAISIPLESVMHLFARAHYALGVSLRPSLIHIFAIIFTILLGYFGAQRYGIVIIPISFAAGLLLQNLLLLFSYRRLLAKSL